MENKGKLSKKTISGILLFGIVGHIAWCIENTFLNLYVYRTIGTDLKIVSAMVAVSAIVATFATIIMGWVSDRMGSRKKLMCYGYILWGLSVMMFSLFTIKNMQEFFSVDRNRAIVLACVGMVIADSIMSFFGSASNDAAYHAWVTDNTNKNNRGRIEALLSVCAVVAYLLVFVPFELGGVTPNKYYDASGASVAYPVPGGTTVTGNWTLFYCVLGGLVIAAGIVGLFLIKDVPTLKPNKSLKFKDLFYGFRPSVIKKNKYFFLILATISISYIANNCYSNYLMIYMQHTLRCDDYIKTLGYLLPMAIIYGLSAIAGITAGVLLDKKDNKTGFILPGIIVSSVGAVMMFFFSPTFLPIGVPMLALFCVGAFVQAIGSSMIAVVCLAIIRNLTPPDKVGRFLGVKMVFCVMLPMSIGSVLSAAISSSDKYITGYDEFGNAVYTCPPIMFLLCAIIVLFAVLTLIPILKSKPECLLAPAEGVDVNKIAEEVAAAEARPYTQYSSSEKSMQREYTTETPLLNEDGTLNAKGWARRNLFSYDRNKISKRYRKEWEYYLINNGTYMGLVSIVGVALGGYLNVSVLDVKTGKFVESCTGYYFGDCKMNSVGDAPGEFSFKAGKASISIKITENSREVQFAKGDVECSFQMDILPSHENITTVLPFKNEPKRFFMTTKQNSMPCEGFYRNGEKTYAFTKENTFCCMDWGRVAAPRNVVWFWGNGSTYVTDENDEKHIFGFEITWGIGDESNATETCLFYDGKAHKIGAVDVEVFPGPDKYMQPWHIVSEDGRFDFTMTPDCDNHTDLNLSPIIRMHGHQVFGNWSGKAVLDDGTELVIDDMHAFCEYVENKW